MYARTMVEQITNKAIEEILLERARKNTDKSMSDVSKSD